MQKRETWDDYYSSYKEELSDKLKGIIASKQDMYKLTYSIRHKHYKRELEYCSLKYLLKEIDFTPNRIFISESPDFILETINGNIGVEVTDLYLTQSNNRHQQAILDEIINECSNEVVKYGIVDKVIRIEVKPMLFEQLNRNTKQYIFTELTQKIVNSSFASDYFGDVELIDNEIGNLIYHYGSRNFDKVTVLDIRKMVDKKEERFANCYQKISANSDLKEYWLIIRIPKEITFPSKWIEKQSFDSKFNKIYIVDHHYNRKIITVK